jgi:hypothetical protein
VPLSDTRSINDTNSRDSAPATPKQPVFCKIWDHMRHMYALHFVHHSLHTLRSLLSHTEHVAALWGVHPAPNGWLMLLAAHLNQGSAALFNPIFSLTEEITWGPQRDQKDITFRNSHLIKHAQHYRLDNTGCGLLAPKRRPCF